MRSCNARRNSLSAQTGCPASRSTLPRCWCRNARVPCAASADAEASRARTRSTAASRLRASPCCPFHCSTWARRMAGRIPAGTRALPARVCGDKDAGEAASSAARAAASASGSRPMIRNQAIRAATTASSPLVAASHSSAAAGSTGTSRRFRESIRYSGSGRAAPSAAFPAASPPVCRPASSPVSPPACVMDGSLAVQRRRFYSQANQRGRGLPKTGATLVPIHFQPVFRPCQDTALQ